MRAFFAVELPDALAEPLAAVQAELSGADGLRFTDPAQAHVTLKFLGEVPDSDVDDVIAAGERAVDRAGVDPFACAVGGLGVFPDLEYISVVWAGVDEGTDPLAALHESLDAETTSLGYEPESHAFTPHVTLARMTDARGKELVQDVVQNRNPSVGRFDVEAVALKESSMTDDGPVYATVETVAL